RHNSAGGQVQISTATRDGRAVLTVANTGPAIPPEAVGRLFQPFWRLGGRRGPHDNRPGLGPSIVPPHAPAPPPPPTPPPPPPRPPRPPAPGRAWPPPPPPPQPPAPTAIPANPQHPTTACASGDGA